MHAISYINGPFPFNVSAHIKIHLAILIGKWKTVASSLRKTRTNQFHNCLDKRFDFCCLSQWVYGLG